MPSPQPVGVLAQISGVILAHGPTGGGNEDGEGDLACIERILVLEEKVGGCWRRRGWGWDSGSVSRMVFVQCSPL